MTVFGVLKAKAQENSTLAKVIVAGVTSASVLAVTLIGKELLEGIDEE